jgi:hypothetical protein
MAKAAKRAAKKALVGPGKMGPKAGVGGVGGSAGRGGVIAASRQDARSAKAAARRDAILEAALDEFSAKGFVSAPSAPASPRARSICILPTRRACSRN